MFLQENGVSCQIVHGINTANQSGVWIVRNSGSITWGDTVRIIEGREASLMSLLMSGRVLKEISGAEMGDLFEPEGKK